MAAEGMNRFIQQNCLTAPTGPNFCIGIQAFDAAAQSQKNQ
jgi:hypothetical protein